ncbi:acetate/propionate family kinase [Halanaerobium congolense]|jgi:acetate kinase|uniref:Acetate kinase n=1 Tax=Halanaerobium congolense TaxID=54121 RepID=A0A1G6KIT1_9FIRM|nr:acetate kinase [Halanaerobium congolense]PXV62556.1 acetate kinase [Halanaerobium congolense]SDC30475.1 acetate kinase [Halanaerobium congolense]
MKIFVLNSGGSSVKFKILEMPAEEEIASGKVEKLGSSDAIFHLNYNNNKLKEIQEIKNHGEAINLILETLIKPEIEILNDYEEIDVVGHRVVHAGENFTGSVMIDQEVIDTIRDSFDLAPLHNPPNLKGIEIFKEILPGTPMVAVFDNAFHAEIPDYVRTYAIPYKYYEKHAVRRYGFHGITFNYMTDRAAEILERDKNELKLFSLMLGSGCTANAFKNGKSFEVSTGFTPLEGLVQSTRSGDIDPAAVLYLMRKENISIDEMDRILNSESGWKGISGISNDFRKIVEAYQQGNEMAELAINTAVHRAQKYLGAYTAVMGGLDAVVFAGGVGENSVLLREKICSDLEHLNIKLDKKLNQNLEGEGIISAADSRVKIVVVNTDEEVVIARESYNKVV